MTRSVDLEKVRVSEAAALSGEIWENSGERTVPVFVDSNSVGLGVPGVSRTGRVDGARTLRGTVFAQVRWLAAVGRIFLTTVVVGRSACPSTIDRSTVA